VQSRLAPLGYDRKLSDAERTGFISQVGEVAAMQTSMFNSAGQILNDAHRIGIEPSREALAARLAQDRYLYGACVAELKLPLS
jgi:hypothetical protein